MPTEEEVLKSRITKAKAEVQKAEASLMEMEPVWAGTLTIFKDDPATAKQIKGYRAKYMATIDALKKIVADLERQLEPRAPLPGGRRKSKKTRKAKKSKKGTRRH